MAAYIATLENESSVGITPLDAYYILGYTRERRVSSFVRSLALYTMYILWR